MLMGEVRAESLMRAMDRAVLGSLTTEQKTAIHHAAQRDAWQRHPVDIRLSLPSPFGLVYVTLIGGRERRSKARLALERAEFPIRGAANAIVIASLLVTLGLAGFGAWVLFTGA